MKTILLYSLICLMGYLIGCSNLAYFISRRKGVNLRGGGSGNLGTSNATILMGWKAGVLVGIHDIGKAVAAVLLARALCPNLPFIGAAAGVCCVLGHIFPFYLRFKGGKGLASYLGMTIALNWKLAIAVLILVVLLTLITDYIVVGTVATVITVPAAMGLLTGSWIVAGVLCLATAVILCKHRENYVRIYNGTEIGFRRTRRGEDRIV